MINMVNLRKVEEDDLPLFFEQQLDPAANHMAAFTVKDPSDWQAFMDHWTKITADETIIMRTILFHGQVAGHIECFEQFGQPSVGYWIGREFWGRGVATAALSQFLTVVKARPLYARAVTDNIASQRVLEKCGFKHASQGKGFANARGREVEEYIFELID